MLHFFLVSNTVNPGYKFETMNLLEKLGIKSAAAGIDWQMTPIDTFALFESRGDMQRIKSSRERHYYFYIDNWQQPARLCLMERGLRFARVMAVIAAPQPLIDQCVAEQGKTHKEHSYAINSAIRKWLEKNIIDSDDTSKIIPVIDKRKEDAACGLPGPDDRVPELALVSLRKEPAVISEEQLPAMVAALDFFESSYNPAAGFAGYLVDNRDGLTVTDRVTNITWQRHGSEHGFRRRIMIWMAEINRQQFAGCSDWRLPTIEEALSLLKKDRNRNGLYLAPCFSPDQGYIFTADRHRPGGYWFVDFRQARVFWAGGTFSGGFARLCRG